LWENLRGPAEKPVSDTTTDLDAPGSAERDSPSLRIGDVIDGHYTIERVLGSGGMGTVYLTRDERLHRAVAVKLVHEDLLAQAELREAFAAEARAMALVRHPNVVTIHTLGEHRGQPYIVMEHVPGSDLATWRRQRGQLSWQEALQILDPLCCGVQAIHDAGTLHRDIKPANVLVDTGGRIAVSDFGLSLRVADIAAGEAGFAFGTPANIAPELARDEAIEGELATRIDTYALGVLAYELLAGQPPFPIRSVPGLLEAHGYRQAPPPSTVREDLPAAFDAAVLRALAKTPADRTPSPDAFRHELLDAARTAEHFPRGLKILTVDDDATALLAVRDLLLLAFPGTDVVSVTDPVTAVRVAVRDRPDLVITDLHMPHGGGTKLCAALRSDPRTAETPIIVLTGHGGASDWQHLRKLGVDRFLVKPIDFDTLEATIWSLSRTRPRSPKSAEP
jgi:serine/threonine protein kinase